MVALGGIGRQSWVEEVVGFSRAAGGFFFFSVRSRSGVFMTIEFGVFK